MIYSDTRPKDDLIARLRRKEPMGVLSGCMDCERFVNPDGPEAADRIEALEQSRLTAINDALERAAKGWRCFHCGEYFAEDNSSGARLHFGHDEGSTPACLIKGAEGGLLRALRDAETQADDAIQAMHNESTDAAVAYHRQRCRHNQALIAAEELGYERGLADGRNLKESNHD